MSFWVIASSFRSLSVSECITSRATVPFGVGLLPLIRGHPSDGMPCTRVSRIRFTVAAKVKQACSEAKSKSQHARDVPGRKWPCRGRVSGDTRWERTSVRHHVEHGLGWSLMASGMLFRASDVCAHTKNVKDYRSHKADPSAVPPYRGEFVQLA